MSKHFITFKHDIDKEKYFMVHPVLQKVVANIALYCLSNNLPMVITDTISTRLQDQKLGRVSPSHSTGRAIDMSDNGWSAFEIQDFKDYFNKKYKDIASVSLSDNKSRLVVYHKNANGGGYHFHISIHSNYSLKLH